MRKSLFIGVAVAVIAGVIGTYFVAFWPAQGDVAVSVTRDEASNPLLSSGQLTIVSGEQEYVVDIEPSSESLAERTVSTPITWSLRTPLIVTFESGFGDDERAQLVFTPQDAGLWAGNAGQVVSLNLTISDTEFTLQWAPEAGSKMAFSTTARANETLFREEQDMLRATCEADGLDEMVAALLDESDVFLDYFSGYSNLKDLGIRQGNAITVALRLAEMSSEITAYVEDFDRTHPRDSQPIQVQVGQEILRDIATKREQQGIALLDFKVELYNSLNRQISADGNRFEQLRDELVETIEAEAPVRLSKECAEAYPY